MPSANVHASLSQRTRLTTAGEHDDIIEKQITDLARRLAPVSDRDFLTEFALAACELVSADMFMIGRLNPYSNLVRSVRLVRNGAIVDDAIIYSLDGTPCERAAESGICTYKTGVARLFPQDRMLKDLNIEGYAGAALKTAEGDILGVLVALTTSTMTSDRLTLRVLDYFNNRVAAALEMFETAKRHDWVIAEMTGGVWDWDMVTGGVTASENLQSKLDADARGTLDLSKIERAIHPDDQARHTDALNGHLKEDTPYNLKLRLRGRTGEYRWHHAHGKAMRNAAGRPVRMIACLSDIHDLVVADDGE